MANRGFFCLDGYLKRTAKLSDQELGRLFRALMVYHATGEITELTGRESVAFDFIREDIDAANEAYAAKCETNRRNRLGTVVNDRVRPSTTDNEEEREETNADESRNININENIKEKEKRESMRETTARFEKFWVAYPRHEGKKKACDAFTKLNPDDALLARILDSIGQWKQSDQWQEDGGRFIPHPATWLNGRRWEDEVPAFHHDQKPANVVVAQQYDQRSYAGQDESAEDLMNKLMARRANA